MTIEDFFTNQLACWPEAAENFRAAGESPVRHTGYAGMLTRLNARRTASTTAKTDTASVKARPCFLCAANRPAVQTADHRFEGYELLVNPFPIFSRHFTIAATGHVSQSLQHRGAHMWAMAREMAGYAVFYNGPRCGASAPDHAHFQAVPAAELPFVSQGFPFATISFEATDPRQAETLLTQALRQAATLPGQPAGAEPMVNILAVAADTEPQPDTDAATTVRFIVIPRRAHRPRLYGTMPGQMLVSPATIDLAGVMVTVRPDDFEALSPELVKEILDEVCYPSGQ